MSDPSSTMTSVPGARNNNLVAESDLDAAIEAIRGKFDSLKDNEFAKDCCESLVTNLTRIVQPQSDEAFHTYIYNQVSCDDDTEQMTNENDIDPRELIDQEALARVQELRAQVRAEASRVKQLRDSVLDRSVQIASRQVKLIAGGNLSTAEEPILRIDTDASRAKLREMQNSLQEMQQALQDTETVLPEKMTSLKDTIDAIETSLNRGLSQTEIAIMSQPEDNFSPPIPKEPEQRLAEFLRQE